MNESPKPKDPFDLYREEAREFNLPEQTQKILAGADSVFWKLAIKAQFDPLVFMSLYRDVDESLKSQDVFDAMVDFLTVRNQVVTHEQAVEDERQRLIDSLGSNKILN